MRDPMPLLVFAVGASSPAADVGGGRSQNVYGDPESVDDALVDLIYTPTSALPLAPPLYTRSQCQLNQPAQVGAYACWCVLACMLLVRALSASIQVRLSLLCNAFFLFFCIFLTHSQGKVKRSKDVSVPSPCTPRYPFLLRDSMHPLAHPPHCFTENDGTECFRRLTIRAHQ